MHLAIFKLYRK